MKPGNSSAFNRAVLPSGYGVITFPRLPGLLPGCHDVCNVTAVDLSRTILETVPLQCLGDDDLLRRPGLGISPLQILKLRMWIRICLVRESEAVGLIEPLQIIYDPFCLRL